MPNKFLKFFRQAGPSAQHIDSTLKNFLPQQVSVADWSQSLNLNQKVADSKLPL